MFVILSLLVCLIVYDDPNKLSVMSKKSDRYFLLDQTWYFQSNTINCTTFLLLFPLARDRPSVARVFRSCNGNNTLINTLFFKVSTQNDPLNYVV